MDEKRRDWVHAVRVLLRSPGFSVPVVAILAAAMGATTAIYGVVRGVLLDPLPHPAAETLHALWVEHDQEGRARLTPGHLQDLRSLEVFSSVAVFGGTSAALAIDDEPIHVQGGRVTPGYFRTLGIPLAAGRGFSDEEGVAGGPPAVVLGHGLWRRAFGGDPEVVGRSIDLDGSSFRVVGVAGPGLYPTTVLVSGELPFTRTAQDFFVPLRYTADEWQNRRSHLLGAVARRAPGVSREAASEALAALSARLRRAEPLHAAEAVVPTSLEEEITGDVRPALILLMAAVGLVLVIAVVDVGALFVLRADDRIADVRIRVALGAPRSRIVSRLVAESTVIVGTAGLLALGIAALAIDLMQRAVPYQIPRMDAVGIDPAVFATAVAAGAVLAVAFGTAPAWRLFHGIGSGPHRGATAGRGRQRLQQAIVGVQSALGVVVLVGAVLLVRSFSALQATDPGFDGVESWVFEISGSGVDAETLVARVGAVPGVAAAAVTYDHPLQRSWSDTFELPGRTLDPDRSIGGSLRPFGAGYFEVAGIAVREGRIPTASEFAGETPYAVVNASFRQAYFGEESPIGRTVAVPTARRIYGEDRGSFVIAAVVADVRFLGPERGGEPAVYLPRDHFPVGWSSLVVRPETPDLPVGSRVRAVVREVAPGAAIRSAARLGDLLDAALARPRFNRTLLVAFGTMGLVLCGLGAYGLVGRVVAGRSREIGIRRALGARAPGVARMVMAQALRPVALGVIVGLGGAWLVDGSLSSLLYGVVPGDPTSFAVSALFMVAVAGVAVVAPTLRALAIDPADTLREE